MKSDINLVPTTSKVKRTYGRIFVFSAAVFGVIFVIALLLIAYSFILKTRVKGLEQQEALLKGNISQYAIQKERLLVTAERLGMIRKIISTRKKLDLKVASILSFVPNEFGIEAINADKDVISLKLASPSLREFDALIEEKIPSLAKDKALGLKKINIASFAEKGNNYVLSLDFDFGTKTKK